MSYNYVRIQLDPPYQRGSFRQHLFTPGDRISGKVVFNLKEDEKIDRIFIDFKGKCTVRDGGGDDERVHTQILFAHTKVLFKGPFKMRAALYEYPFLFQFPETFEFKNTDFRDNVNYESKFGQLPLPPTVETQWGGSANEPCAIYYHLTAKIPKTWGSWEDKVSLHFTPFRKEFDPAPLLKRSKDYQTFHRNYRLTSELIPRPFTKGEAVKHAFHRHSTTQTINFSFSAIAPTNIVIGRAYPIEVTVIPTVGDAWETSPQFRLKHYTLCLKASTFVRIPGTVKESTGRQYTHINLSSGSIDVVVVLSKAMKLNGMFPTKPIAPPPPTFTSFSARRTYELELKMTVSCLDEESRFKIKWPDVTIYSSKMEPGIEEAMRAIENGTMIAGLDDEGGLPSYSGGTEVEGTVEELPAYQR